MGKEKITFEVLARKAVLETQNSLSRTKTGFFKIFSSLPDLKKRKGKIYFWVSKENERFGTPKRDVGGKILALDGKLLALGGIIVSLDGKILALEAKILAL